MYTDNNEHHVWFSCSKCNSTFCQKRWPTPNTKNKSFQYHDILAETRVLQNYAAKNTSKICLFHYIGTVLVCLYKSNKAVSLHTKHETTNSAWLLCHTNCKESNVFTCIVYGFPTRWLFEVIFWKPQSGFQDEN